MGFGVWGLGLRVESLNAVSPPFPRNPPCGEAGGFRGFEGVLVSGFKV